jgi:hypothetical protein
MSDAADDVADEGPLGPDEFNLALLASRSAPDALLKQLADRAEVGGGVGVALLVNGMLVMGKLAKAEEMAEDIDAEWTTIMDAADAPDNISAEEWAETRKRVTSQGAKEIQAQREEEEQISSEAEPHRGETGLDPSAMPAELTRRAIVRNGHCHLTLIKASIAAPGTPGVIPVKVMRVAIDQIGGWWLLRSDEKGNSSQRLWSTDAPNLTFPEPGHARS